MSKLNIIFIALIIMANINPVTEVPDLDFVKAIGRERYYTFYPKSHVSIIRTINEIPPEYHVSTTSISTELNKSKLGVIKFYHKDDDMGLIGCNNCEIEYNSRMPYFRGKYVHVKDVYTNSAASLVTLDDEYIELEKNKALKPIRAHPNGPVVDTYESVIALGHNSVFIFSHWFYDFLSPLTMFPQEIIDKSVYIVSRDRLLCEESLAIFGVKSKRIISVRDNEWVFAKNAYIARDPLPHNSHFGTAMRNLSVKFHKYFHLDQVKATRYCLSNRRAKYRRRLHNFDEIVETVRKEFPLIKFEVVDDETKHLIDTAKTWASAKLMFMPTGSNFVKNIFMHSGSVCVVALSQDTQDETIAYSSGSHGVHVLYFVVRGMRHHAYSEGENICDPQLAVRCIGLGIDCAKNGYWASNESFYDCKDKTICI